MELPGKWREILRPSAVKAALRSGRRAKRVETVSDQKRPNTRLAVNRRGSLLFAVTGLYLSNDVWKSLSSRLWARAPFRAPRAGVCNGSEAWRPLSPLLCIP
jgi:hypothetical protein